MTAAWNTLPLPLFTSKWLLAVAWLACVAYVHFRGQVRHGFLRQLSDHSTLMAPLNALIYLFSATPRQPILDARQFPELSLLRDNWETIRDEARALYGIGAIGQSDGLNDLGFNSFFKAGWRRFYFHWYGAFLPSALSQCPMTSALLKQTPSVKAARFTLLAPGSRLPRHRDPYAGSLRYHLGLTTPNSEQCRIFVDGQLRSWRDGEDLMFDETYIHAAENHTDQTRIILFCDVERPLRTPIARGFNRLIGRTLAAASASRNQPGEPLGLLNHLFKYVYSLRLVGKRIKRENRRLYYALKYTLMLGLGYWIFAP
ncbi:MAG: aspartyl/asparaginyl beta-hydroxylase domain-containing protein [Panacagrimonas sp.]